MAAPDQPRHEVTQQYMPRPVVNQNGRRAQPQGRSAYLNYVRYMQNASPITQGESSDAKPPMAGSSLYTLNQTTRHTATPGSATVETFDLRSAAMPNQMAAAQPIATSAVVTATMPSMELPSGAKVAGMSMSYQQIPVQPGDVASRMNSISQCSSGSGVMR